MKRVLIISYYWPPAGGISVIRPLKLAKYLKIQGWVPIICTAENPHYPFEDLTSINASEEGLEVLKVPIFEPYGIYKALTGQKHQSALADVIQNVPKNSLMHQFSVWIRGNFFVPDARCFWIGPVIKKIATYISENPVDAIITTGPPHSVNRIGALLKKKFNLPWIADFQDPWTQVDYYKHFKITSWAHSRHRKMENEVFAHADLITIVSDSWKVDLQHIGAKKVEVIPLGFDPDDFKSSSILDQLFSMTHLGLLGEDRNPETLLHVIKAICEENSDFANYFRLNLVGKVNPKLSNLVASLNLKSNVFFIGQVSRELALKYMQNSQLLLLLLNKAENVSGRIPGKIFEYMGAKRPVISLGPSGTDVSKIILKSRLGQNIPYNNFDALKEYMLESFALFRSSGLHVDDQLLKRYSHEEVSATFVHHLNQISSI